MAGRGRGMTLPAWMTAERNDSLNDIKRTDIEITRVVDYNVALLVDFTKSFILSYLDISSQSRPIPVR